ncbi:MAG: retropepsin-like aspartic protease [Pseudomonadota bacterium]
MRLALLIAVIAVSIAPARSAAPIASAPYQIGYGGLYVVDVRLNGQGPYPFILDTGSTTSLIFDSLLEDMTPQLSGAPPQSVIGLADRGLFDAFTLGDIELAGLTLEDAEGPILPSWPGPNAPRGLLGLNFLNRYILVFDHKTRRIDFYDPSAPPDPDLYDRWSRVRLDPGNFGDKNTTLVTLRGDLNGVSTRLIFDLGAERPIANFAVLEEIIDGAAFSRSRTDRRQYAAVVDIFRSEARVHAVRFSNFSVGKTRWSDEIFLITEALIFEELDVADKPFGLFGASLLRNRNFMIDFPGETLWIGPVRK